MEFEVVRYFTATDFTLGALFQLSAGRQLLCFTLEDEKRTVKVFGETRIPSGRYRMKLRKFGGFHERYNMKFSWHIGMIEIEDVPDFSDILIHIGNTDDDTAGCLLVGETQDVRGFIGRSELAYTRIYPKIARELDNEEPCFITFTDWS